MNTHAAVLTCAAPWVELRPPTTEDGARIWRLVKESPPLELNSCYAYVLLCRDFHDTCIVAEADNGLAGFVCGYRRPASPDTVFVWQVAVGPCGRKRGLGVTMLVALLAGEANRDLRYLEATVTPSNEASQRLFRKLARELQTGCEETPGIAAHCFGDGQHEEEVLFRVGPTNPAILSEARLRLLKTRSEYSDIDLIQQTRQ
ncbi:MAG: diaminobutyrate acetyltransferase [FCB group bacterium]|jgi:L-2,4-diaminobutyric acid acetyltransferase|nr:diaminobutyrate acetyltransferase [FCB group bacterium]